MSPAMVARLFPGLTRERAAQITTDTSGHCHLPAGFLAALTVTR